MKKFWYLIPLLLIFISVFVMRTIRTSVFLRSRRVNIVFYGKQSNFYSIDRASGLNYYVSFYPDLKTDVPGGYGIYRLGALGKLVNLERKPDLVRKTFSHLVGNFVDIYFYPKTSEIYFGPSEEKVIKIPKIGEIFTLGSNANLLDRIYLSLIFLNKSGNRFTEISAEANQFAKDYQGNFYEKAYRKENFNIQIVYAESFKTASSMSQMIEGEGIRVADISQEEYKGVCILIQKSKQPTKTGETLKNFFSCQPTIGDTGAYDIILKLGEREGDWEIN